MSKYTTGELAKLCGVSVRTVQYYDSRGILVPSELSEGGRRLYSEADLGKLKVICFLRGLDIPINSIRDLLHEEHPEAVIGMLLDEQERILRREIEDKQARVSKISAVRRELDRMNSFSVESIGDIAHLMENKNQTRRLHIKMVVIGLLMDAIQIATLMVWILEGVWLPYLLSIPVVVLMGIWISCIYYQNTVYICPECHSVFRPRFREFFFAHHTPYTRKLTCPTCGHRGFCVETYGREPKSC